MKVVYSSIYSKHDPPHFPHIENSTRLELALDALGEVEVLSPEGAGDPLEVHDGTYVEMVRRASEAEEQIDIDTYTNRFTYESALMALGGAFTAYKVEGIALVRPPGHHAGRYGRAMGAPTQGFCIFNNIAYAASKAEGRVAIIDFDVHHGNGTQEIFYLDPKVLHIDLHQDPSTIYPGTGFPFETGDGEGKGTKVNILFPPGGGDDLVLEVIPFIQSLLDQFKPDVVGFSAGFDGFSGDGLASLEFTEASFEALGGLREKRRWFAVLEGGYSVGLRRGLPAFVRGVERKPEEPRPKESKSEVKMKFTRSLEETKYHLRERWKL
ncbi:histone deacetylase family protein [Sulfodiicoccus acidiphilus]|nr:histone deacetylase family protein [Sulfodiicoccus acidiphilus]